jgi:hypothetical protein
MSTPIPEQKSTLQKMIDFIKFVKEAIPQIGPLLASIQLSDFTPLFDYVKTFNISGIINTTHKYSLNNLFTILKFDIIQFYTFLSIRKNSKNRIALMKLNHVIIDINWSLNMTEFELEDFIKFLKSNHKLIRKYLDIDRLSMYDPINITDTEIINGEEVATNIGFLQLENNKRIYKDRKSLVTTQTELYKNCFIDIIFYTLDQSKKFDNNDENNLFLETLFCEIAGIQDEESE